MKDNLMYETSSDEGSIIACLDPYFSVVTVTGDRMRAVIWAPAGNVAALRSPTAVAAVPAPAPAVAPMAAPLAPPAIAPRIAPRTAPPPILAALEFPGASP